MAPPTTGGSPGPFRGPRVEVTAPATVDASVRRPPREGVTTPWGSARIARSVASGGSAAIADGPEQMADVLRILFVEDHLVVGLGVAATLEAAGEFESLGVVGSVDAAATRTADADQRTPDVVVADIDLGREGMALDLPQRLGTSGPPVVFLTGHDEPAVLRAAVLSGAAGLVHKDAPIDELARAIRLAAAGQTWFRRADVEAARSGPADPSPRELEVLRGVVGGLSNKEIGGVMGIEERTVETHVRRMMDRYDATNRTDLAVLGLRRGWVALPRGDGR